MPPYRSRNNRSSNSQKGYAYKPRSLRRTEIQSKKKIVYLIIFCLIFIFVMINWGLPSLIGGLSIFNGLKKTDQSSSIPLDTAIAPPVLNIPYEATNSAVIEISGYSTPNTKVEIYVNDNLTQKTETNESGSFTISNVGLELGTNYIYGKTVSDNNKTSLASKKIPLLYSDEKPLLEVSEPSDNKEIHGGDKKVIVSGKTDSQNNLTVNSTSIILNGDGTFSKEIPLNDGENTVTITASDNIGNATSVTKKVTYFP